MNAGEIQPTSHKLWGRPRCFPRDRSELYPPPQYESNRTITLPERAIRLMYRETDMNLGGIARQ
ncbi:unnamed protein product [Penicillium camemberti]|uniref:Str. FM013 n=1 Tax=Penicillium camemberti (strain FM 013) TaxID=1429867 RepID=A0A0G4P9W0_PENC3|nr:unnamed protein product [Penicillium camemberti]